MNLINFIDLQYYHQHYAAIIDKTDDHRLYLVGNAHWHVICLKLFSMLKLYYILLILFIIPFNFKC